MTTQQFRWSASEIRALDIIRHNGREYRVELVKPLAQIGKVNFVLFDMMRQSSWAIVLGVHDPVDILDIHIDDDAVIVTRCAPGLRMIVRQVNEMGTLYEWLVLPSWARNNDRDLALEGGVEWTAATATERGEYWLEYLEQMQDNIRQSRI